MTTKRIARSTGAASTTAVGNLLSVRTPDFISLVGRPANQRPFTVIRSDENDNPNRVVRTARRGSAAVKKAKRGDDAILMITFPGDYDEEKAQNALIEFGMDDYTLTLSNGVYVATRADKESDLQLIANSKNVIRATSDGIMLTMSEEAYSAPEQQKVPGVAVVRYEFNTKYFDSEGVSSWLGKNSVDISQDAAQNSTDASISVQRREVADDVEVRRIEVEKGVVAVISRSDSYDVPESMVGVVEAAYGNWGWGNLDFNASMADRAFCDAFSDAKSALNDVLCRIVYYSELPLDTRKTLVNNALSQFGAFINDAIDALPRQVLLLATRSEPETEKEQQTMTTQDDASKATKTQRSEQEQQEADAKPVTRGELRELIKETFAELVPAKSETVARAEEPKEQPAKEEATTAGLTRADFAAVVGEALKPITDRMEKLENTTVVRSDQEPAAKDVKTKKDVPMITRNDGTKVKDHNAILRGSLGFGQADEK